MNFEHQRPLLEREIASDIERRRLEIIEQIITGRGVETFEDYRRLTGYVAAFDEVFGILENVRSRLNKQEGRTS